MITLEQVEKLTKKTGVSFSEAKAALEASDGDMLEAVLLLEYQGKVQTSASGRFSSQSSEAKSYDYSAGASSERYRQSDGGNTLWEVLKRLLHVANTNHMEILRHEERVILIPISVLILLMLITSGTAFFLLLVGLFFGYRYIFRGPDLGREEINRVMDQTADTVDQLKHHVRRRKDGWEN